MSSVPPFVQWESVLKLPVIGGVLLEDEDVVSAFLEEWDVHISGTTLEKAIEFFGAKSDELRLGATFLKYHDLDEAAFEKLPLVLDNHSDGENYITNRLMSAFEKMWRDSPELACLYLLALFPYPITRELLHWTLLGIVGEKDKRFWKRSIGVQKIFIESFIENKAKKGKDKSKGKNSKDRLNLALDKLRDDGLLLEKNDQIMMFDAVNEYFSSAFKAYFYDEWRSYQQKIAEQYKTILVSDKQDGNRFWLHCKILLHVLAASQKQEAVDQVYMPDIAPALRDKFAGDEKVLQLHLYLLQNFFQNLWQKPDFCLENDTKAYLQAQAGQAIYGLGDKEEAQDLLQVSYPELVKAKNWKSAGSVAYILSEYHESAETPDVNGAIELTKQSAAYTELGRDSDSLYTRLQKLVNLYKTNGDRKEALLLTRKLRELAGKLNRQLPDRPLKTLEQAIARIKAQEAQSFESLNFDDRGLDLDSQSG